MTKVSTDRRDVGELALEGGDITDLEELVIVAGVATAAPD